MRRTWIMNVLFLLVITGTAYANVNLELINAAKKGDKTKVKRCLSKGADVNAKDKKYGRSVLMWAVMSGDKNIARILIKNGADVNATDKNGQTAMTWTALFQGYDLFDLLANAGATDLSRIRTTSEPRRLGNRTTSEPRRSENKTTVRSKKRCRKRIRKKRCSASRRRCPLSR